ncbi:hypothetical protein CPB83DRAFT_811246 [Crepidotus variabilis]|uniref:Transmembrane protein n=1 Tax=Crepidotus variabilis TaxID=179855 RepID=A0A9P6EHY7_9AGAR|nr:hypothetical protein CPB83DRAFT_811246 [Crepidotus variabilis]
MDATNSPTVLPNPFTPLAFIPPNDAYIVSMLVHFAVACLAIMMWDILNYLPEDYQVIFRKTFNWKTLVFIVARLSPFAFFLSLSIFLTSDRVSCGVLQYVWSTLYVLARASTALLFCFRVCAVYCNNRYVVAFFSFSWLVVLGCACLVFPGLKSIQIGPTNYCLTAISGQYLMAAMYSEVINDTLICLAILYKLGGSDWREQVGSWKKIFQPNNQRVTDIFVQDSLIYYLLAASTSVITIIAYFRLEQYPNSAVRVVAALPNSVVTNAIALRVYRNMRLGSPGLLPSPNKGTASPLTHIAFKRGDHFVNHSGTLAQSGTLTSTLDMGPPGKK